MHHEEVVRRDNDDDESIDIEGNPMKRVMKIHSAIKVMLMTLFLPKVSWMTMKKPSGETTTIRTLSIVTVSPTKRIMDIYNEIKIILRLSLS